MVQGDAYSIDITIQNQGQPLSVDGVELVEVTLLNITRSYPEEVTYSDGKFHFPITQQETFKLPPMCPMQVRVKFNGGDVIGSRIQMVEVAGAISKAVL